MLRYGVLGLLIERRGYGYQLVQRLSERLGSAWQLNASSVYGALDQLEGTGLIEAASGGAAGVGGDAGTDAEALTRGSPTDRPSRRAARVVYEATDRGVGEFQAWLARPSLRTSPIRSELALKVALAGPDNVPPLLASIAQEEWTIAQRLSDQCGALGLAPAELPAAIPPIELPKIDASSSSGESVVRAWPSTATALVAAAATTRLQGELAWLECVRATLQRMSAQQIAAASRAGLVGAPSLP
jgi:DNA-binding PadR family transcriptional regulator